VGLDTLEGKAVLVTGASSGVGLCAAEAFAAAGADVALLARGRPGLERAATRVRAQGRRAVVVPADVTDRDAVDDAVEQAIDALGALHVLVPCAALTVYGSFDEVEPEDFDRAVDVTFTGTVNVIRAVLPELDRASGTIVALGSLMSRLPLPMLSSYAAAKHAERGFLNTLRVELRAQRSPVTVSMLHPGAVNTPVWSEMPSANGELPRRPPEAYSPVEVAERLVELALDPRPESVFGAETRALDLLWNVARPAGDIVMILMYHYFRTGRRETSSGVRALREALDRGVPTDGIPFMRPSVTRAVGRVLRAAVP
jgi:NAD(P)-dependent dehydrogenase (short-subunit alcohol dehydrogenase family)